jgi:hypothetical protein
MKMMYGQSSVYIRDPVIAPEFFFGTVCNPYYDALVDLILRIGLATLAFGLISVLGLVITSSSWGPCGPGNPAPVIFALAALFGLPAGAILSVVGMIRHRRATSPLQPGPR